MLAILVLQLFVLAITNGILLSPDVHLMQTVPKLPQYHVYGKSLVLVGGNLLENNTEIYDTIIQLAVSCTLFSINICRCSEFLIYDNN